MKTTLFEALNEADYHTLDHYEVTKVTFNSQARVAILDCPVDDGDVTFADQDIDVIETGDAVAFDVTGEKRVLTFVAKVPWQPTEKVLSPAPAEPNEVERLVREALEKVQFYWPDVGKVIYESDGRWRYLDSDWNLVPWVNPLGGKMSKHQTEELVALCEKARDAVDNERGFPAVFEFDL